MTKKKQINSFKELIGCNEYPVHAYPCITRLFGSDVSLFVGQFSGFAGDGEWVFRSMGYIETKTGLSDSQQRKARQKLIRHEIVEEKRQQIHKGKSRVGLHYRFSWERLKFLIENPEYVDKAYKNQAKNFTKKPVRKDLKHVLNVQQNSGQYPNMIPIGDRQSTNIIGSSSTPLKPIKNEDFCNQPDNLLCSDQYPTLEDWESVSMEDWQPANLEESIYKEEISIKEISKKVNQKRFPPREIKISEVEQVVKRFNECLDWIPPNSYETKSFFQKHKTKYLNMDVNIRDELKAVALWRLKYANPEQIVSDSIPSTIMTVKKFLDNRVEERKIELKQEKERKEAVFNKYISHFRAFQSHLSGQNLPLDTTEKRHLRVLVDTFFESKDGVLLDGKHRGIDAFQRLFSKGLWKWFEDNQPFHYKRFTVSDVKRDFKKLITFYSDFSKGGSSGSSAKGENPSAMVERYNKLLKRQQEAMKDDYNRPYMTEKQAVSTPKKAIG